MISAQFGGFPSMKTNASDVLQSMMDTIDQKPFMFHHAQVFPQYVILNAYQPEKLEFKKVFKCVPVVDIPSDANIISSHIVYKSKVEDEESLRLKARIEPHGNKDSQRLEMKSDSSMCSPVGIRVVLTIAAIRRWNFVKADVKAACLQTGEAKRDVYVCPPREICDRHHYWLLLATTYGLVNTNANFQYQWDELFLDLGLRHLAAIPQLFYSVKNGSVVLIVIKIVDDLLITGETNVASKFIECFNRKFKLGTIVKAPGAMKFYGMSIIQLEDFSCTIDADDKLDAIEGFLLSRVRRRQLESTLNNVELSAFKPGNSSIGWLEIVSSPFCAFYASHLQ